MEKNNNLTHRIYDQKTLSKIDKKIKLLGIYNKLDLYSFLNLRMYTQ